MLIGLIDPVGADLARRWLAALISVPPEEREELVEAIEQQIAREFPVE